MKKKKKASILLLLLLCVYLLLPFAVTLVYSLFTEWTGILPSGFTLRNYKLLFFDAEFWMSLMRTMLICIISVVASITTLLLAMYVVVVEYPFLAKYIQFICMIPYALQGVILSISIVSLYSGTGTLFSNRMLMLFGAYGVLVLPYIFQGIRNNINAINTQMLMNAAKMLGCSPLKAYFKVVVPNILPGIFVSSLLSVSVIFGDFVLANNIAGNSYQNIQVYLFRKLSISSGLSSAVVVVIFLMVFLMTGMVLLLQGIHQKKEKNNGVYRD